MTSAQSTDQYGEGFAFFRWHSIKFPGRHTCDRETYCWQQWRFRNWR